MRQYVTIFDLKTSSKAKEQSYLAEAVANLHSVSSTTVKAGDLPGDGKVVEVNM